MALKIDGDMIGGQLVGAHRRPSTAFSSGRVCSEPGCGTILSIYNSDTRCSLHDFDHNLLHVGARKVRSHKREGTTTQAHSHPRAA